MQKGLYAPYDAKVIGEMVEKGIRFTDARREFEKRFIAHVLQRHNGNLSRAAAELKVHRNTLGKKIDILGMDACFMSMGEVAYEIRESVDVLVGAEGLEPALLRLLADDPQLRFLVRSRPKLRAKRLGDGRLE